MTNIDTTVEILNPAKEIQTTSESYFLGMDDDSLSSDMSAAYYFMLVFYEFVEATNKLQFGATSQTEALEKITEFINTAKDAKLKEDNEIIKQKIEDTKDKKDDKFQKAQLEVTKAEGQYKLDDTTFQSKLQALSPATTASSNLTTSISQNNNIVNQMAMYVINISKILAESLIKAM